MRLKTAAFVSALAIAGLALTAAPGGAPMPPKPAYDADGKLLRPRNVQEWIAVGTSVGLGYSENEPTGGPGPLRTVLLEPKSYQHYKATGEFADGTMLALAVYPPRSRASIAKNGHFQGKLSRVEIALKDSAKFDEKWAYFDFGGPGEWIASASPFAKERCWSCHRAAGQKDNVFVQFYPVLRDGVAD